MKNILISAVILFLTSCAPTNYYQVFSTETKSGLVLDKQIIFEDSNCRVAYNLWGEGGQAGFKFYNKTNRNITLNLNESFFVLNGEAYSYFQNRIFSSTTSTNKTRYRSSYNIVWNNMSDRKATSNSSSQTSTYIEKSLRTIPPKTFITLREFRVVDSSLRHCALPRTPNRKQPKILTFDQNDTPLKFANVLSYYIQEDSVTLVNDFYVKEISNLRFKDISVRIDTTACGKKLEYSKRLLGELSPKHFYIKYKTY